jgi:hypothetical protein
LVRDAFMQVVDRDGEVVTAFDDRPLPVTPEVLAVARGQLPEALFDADVDGALVRVYVTSADQGALQVAVRWPRSSRRWGSWCGHWWPSRCPPWAWRR